MSEITRSTFGVRWSDLGWGYQIVHDGMVLVAIHGTGKEQSEEARKKYEKVCDIYRRLYTSGRTAPTQQQVSLLAHIIRRDVTDEHHSYGKPNGNTARSLIRRGIIRKVDPYSPSLVYRDFVVLDGNLAPIQVNEDKEE